MACSPTGSEIKFIMKAGASAHDFETGAERYIIESETLSKRSQWITSVGLTGARQIHCDDRRLGPCIVGGDVTFRLRPGELATLLAHFIGTESPTGTFKTEAADPPYFGVLIDRVTQTYEYQDMKAARIVIRTRASALQGGAPQPAEMTVRMIGKERVKGTSWPSSPPALGTGEEFKPFIFEDSALTIDSTAHRKQDIVLVIDNRLEPEYNGGLCPSDICPMGQRVIQMRTRHPFASTELPLTLLDTDGVDGNLKFEYATNGGAGAVSTDFQFGCLQLVEEDPNARGPGRIPLFIDLLVGKTDADPDLIVVNDAVSAT